MQKQNASRAKTGFPQALEIMENLENHNKVACMEQGFLFKKIFRGHCDPQVVDFGGHFQFERVTY